MAICRRRPVSRSARPGPAYPGLPGRNGRRREAGPRPPRSPKSSPGARNPAPWTTAHDNDRSKARASALRPCRVPRPGIARCRRLPKTSASGPPAAKINAACPNPYHFGFHVFPDRIGSDLHISDRFRSGKAQESAIFAGPIGSRNRLDHSLRLFACVCCKIDACFLGMMSTYIVHLQGAFSSH